VETAIGVKADSNIMQASGWIVPRTITSPFGRTWTIAGPVPVIKPGRGCGRLLVGQSDTGTVTPARLRLSLRKPNITSRSTMAALLNADPGKIFIHHVVGHHREQTNNDVSKTHRLVGIG
jgi:hypothetical protein